jgi:hypothetical protein
MNNSRIGKKIPSLPDFNLDSPSQAKEGQDKDRREQEQV